MTDSTDPGGIEQLRRDAARVLGIPPDEIALDDDLTDHGISSLAMVGLLDEWTARGIEIDVADFLSAPTLETVASRLG